MADPQKDEHIEELLSKLQGIFGKLSHAEEEEAKQKIEISQPAPKEPELMEEAPAASAPPPEPNTAPSSGFNLYAEPVETPPVPSTEDLPAPSSVAVPPATAPPAAASNQGSGAYESTVPLEDPEKMIVPTAVYYPPGKEMEARSVAQKLEIMTPKFTKVAFRLRVCAFMLYDPKSDWKETISSKASESQVQTVFVLMDRTLEDAKRKAAAAELEAKGIYFQDVPIASIEKKAFYTDVLLGLVFFFDSRKPSPNASEKTP